MCVLALNCYFKIRQLHALSTHICCRRRRSLPAQYIHDCFGGAEERAAKNEKRTETTFLHSWLLDVDLCLPFRQKGVGMRKLTTYETVRACTHRVRRAEKKARIVLGKVSDGDESTELWRKQEGLLFLFLFFKKKGHVLRTIRMMNKGIIIAVNGDTTVYKSTLGTSCAAAGW